ncbi:DUF192 domain-containing protein [Streptomyces sp. NPDC058685]|uniref:DUF192 domain-containing protein n=1 Tax=Streptomyces sp. NPDC058685 TaxID=3346598 RepID=UPI0036544053
MSGRRRWRDGMGVLRVAGRDAAVPVEIAATYGPRRRGLLGRDGIAGAMLLTPCNSVHTFRMRFTIDVAYLDRELRVVEVRTTVPGRLGRPRLRARHVLEAEAGAMAEWGVVAGARLTIETAGTAGTAGSGPADR